jgi:mRNA interferase HigB
MSIAMRVISQKTLREFWGQYPDSKLQLQSWYKTARAAKWKNLNEVRQAYPSADGVPSKGHDTLTVFNICGGTYRLIVRIRYDYELVNVRCVLTHAEYDKENWKE